MPESVLNDVEGVPGVARAVGDVLGYAQIVDPTTGKVIGTFGPPTAASGWNDLNGFTLKPGGSPPSGADQVVIDAATAEAHDIQVGDKVRILFEGPPGEFTVVGIAGYGESDSLFGATWALFDLPTAQHVLGRDGQLDSVSVVAEEGVSGVDAPTSDLRGAPRGDRGGHGRDGHRRGPGSDQHRTGVPPDRVPRLRASSRCSSARSSSSTPSPSSSPSARASWRCSGRSGRAVGRS